MNQQCYQCRHIHDDGNLAAVSGVWLCPDCKANPSTAVQVYGMLVSSYAPETLTQVRDMVADLEARNRKLVEALRPFAEVCGRVERWAANGQTPPPPFPSDFLDDAETCIWEAARLYHEAAK